MTNFKQTTIAVLLLGIIVAAWMHEWWGSGIPLTPRLENIPQLTYSHRLYHAAKIGALWSAWNPLSHGGVSNLIQRGYLQSGILAQIAIFTHQQVDVVYKLAVALTFILSGLGSWRYLSRLVSFQAAFVGALVYLLLPPHITLASDILDYNIYWAIVPWLLYTAEKFITDRKPLSTGAQTGLLLSLSFTIGNTYFLSTAPFLGLLIAVRFIMVKIPLRQVISYGLSSIAFLLTLSAFITLPTLIELPYTWLPAETNRRQIIDLPRVSDILRLFLLRLQNYDPLAWNMKGRYPDMGWYFGIIPILLSLLSFKHFRQNWQTIIPALSPLLLTIPFFLVMQSSWLKQVIYLVLGILPGLQPLYDHTFRLFLIPTLTLSILTALAVNHLPKKLPVLILICLLLAIDLWPVSRFFFTLPLNAYQPPPEIITILNQPSPGRYWSPFPYVRPLPRYDLEYVNSFITRPRINGEFFYSALAPRYTSEIIDHKLFSALSTGKPPITEISRVLRLGNTRYILLQPAVIPKIGTIVSSFNQENWVTIYQDSRYILLENTEFSDNQWQRPSPNRITGKTEFSASTTVSSYESYFPGWATLIDDHQAATTRIDQAFLGTIVPAGTHSVVFEYSQPWYYQVGKAISLVALILFLRVVIKRSNHHSLKSPTYFEKYLDIAPLSLALWRAVEAKELKLVKQKFHYQRPMLDLGCGFGEFSGVFFNRMIEVGIDISPTDLLQAAQGKTYKNLYVEDARRLSLKSKSFSTVISISVLEHIPNVAPAISEVYRILKPGGLFIATMPTTNLYRLLIIPPILETFGLCKLAHLYFRFYNRVFKHINIWPENKWHRLFTQAGFTIIYSKAILSRQVTSLFELFLLTALPSQLGRWLFGNRLIWGLSWKKRVLGFLFHPLINAKSQEGSNIIIVGQKSSQSARSPSRRERQPL